MKIKETYQSIKKTISCGGETYYIFALPDDLYFNWVRIEGHTGYTVEGLNRQLAQHGLKIVIGACGDNLFGMVVPIDTPEDRALTVEIDTDGKPDGEASYEIIS